MPGFRFRGTLPLSAAQLVLLNFSIFILVGSILLWLPIAHRGLPHHWVDDLFMAASAVCTTGLSLSDVQSFYSPFGQVVLMVLIQVGGLGYMTLFALSQLLVGHRISLRDRLNLQESLDQPGLQGLLAFVSNIVGFTVAVEAIGWGLLSRSMIPEFGWSKGAFLALFHAICAFNNAGFPYFPEGAVHWQRDPLVLLVISCLIVIAGLGYNVNRELISRYLLRRPAQRRWDLLMGVVLSLTALFILVPAIALWFFEHGNSATLARLPVGFQWLNALFMAVQPRSTGFNTLDVGAMSRPSLLIIMALMFVGGGPGGTAGGVKLTTVAIVVAAVIASFRGQPDVNFTPFKRRVGVKVALKAFTVLMFSVWAVLTVTGLLVLIEPHPFMAILFEVVSAFGNAGLSMGITSHLQPLSKFILVVTMLIGRLGILTVMLAIFRTRRRSAIRYVEEPLLVG